MRVYLSGVKTWYTYFMRHADRYGPIPEESIPHQLKYCFPTFWDYYRRMHSQAEMATMPGEHTIVDSGAHSLFGQVGLSVHRWKVSDEGKVDLTHYHKAYMEFLQLNWDKIDLFIELDVADIYGPEIVFAMRKDYQKSGLWSKCVTAWHRANGPDDYDWMLDNAESGHIALQGIRSDEPNLPYNSLIRQAWDRKLKVHGFALLNTPLLKKYPFYSVDCTTWLTAVQYARHLIWTGSRWKLMALMRAGSKNVQKNTIYAAGKHPRAYVTSKEKVIRSIQAIRDGEAYMTEYWKAKGIDWDAHCSTVEQEKETAE